MQVIVPMAGSGQRFVNEGYKDPKPLIKVGGKRILDYVCDMYDRESDSFVFICNQWHLESTDMAKILEDMVSHKVIVSMPPHKLGPVHTVLAAEYAISKDEVIVSYCDNPVIWDYAEFKDFVGDGNVDGCVVSHTSFHPHTLSNNMFAYSKTDKDGNISEIKEKECYTSDRFKEHASSGVYYFRYGNYVHKYFRQLVTEGLSYNGEYYVTLVFNLMIRDQLNICSYLTDFVLAFGTPAEVRNFEAWQSIIGGGQVYDVHDLINCYEYWLKYKSCR